MAGMPCRLFATFLITSAAFAAVTRVDVTEHSNDSGYDRIAGKVYFAVDPKLAPNRIIADIDLAPRNAEGKVEFSADFYMLRPSMPPSATGPRWWKSRIAAARAIVAVQPGRQFSARPGIHAGLGRLGIRCAAEAPGICCASTRQSPPTTANRFTDWFARNGKAAMAPGTPADRVTTIPLGDRDELGYPVADAQVIRPTNSSFATRWKANAA